MTRFLADQGEQIASEILPGFELARSKQALVKYNPNHDPQTGEFASGDGLQETNQRAWSGRSVELRTHMSKLEVGALGERVALDYLRQQGFKDARALNLRTNNFPVDMVADHEAIEVKAGLASNSDAAQQWRATIGQPGKAETEWLRTASAQEKAEWNQRKAAAIMARKAAAVRQLSKELGTRVKGKTIALILNPDTKVADIHVFAGFHHRIGWNSDLARSAYVGSFRYASA